ncbi:hypothetical protein G7Y89_g2862 [Cudoniella acicularis]|uniref:Major facilitator superfamily (MFS) profile domain-containing protein n=1 Tax=Cudoniella acicularis TaxID=354080 RepID=A0A8H4RUA5_9HELO|nr:hypothetical protein G7Y89_g2862 [Cudoniella acicularis]
MAIDKPVTSGSDSIICPSAFPCYGTQSPKSPVTVTTTTLNNSSRIDTGDNPFADPEIAELYRLVYEEAQYECRHVFDPELVWTPEEEKQIVRRIDWRVCFWACVMFFALQVDRGNLSQALSDDMLTDINITTNNYNVGNTIYLVAFVCGEFPSQLISKKIGPDRWIPTLITLWSIVGMSQGGFVPDIVLWLSYFYTSRELPIRLSFFWTSISLTGIITSFMGFGILHMRGVAGWAGWRWLFLLEGFITLLIGIASYFMMPASAVQTKAWYRPNGWFTEREEAIVVNRVLRDDPSKVAVDLGQGDMHNRQAITPSRLWAALKDYDLWPIYVIGFFSDIPPSPVGNYLTLILRSLGFSTFNTNLLTIPSSVAHIITLLTITWLSERFNERTFFAMAQNLWTLPCLLMLHLWSGVVKDAWGTYALVTVILSFPYSHAIIVGWASKNSNNVGTRSVSVTIYNIMVQAGNMYSNNIYVADDAPLYRNGNRTLVIINCACLAMFGFTKLYYVLRNRHRDRIWVAMSSEERYEYTRYAKETGSKRLDFRFAH